MDLFVSLTLASALGIACIWLIVSRMPHPDRRWMLQLLLASFAVRLALASVFAAVPSMRFVHEDAEGYEWWGMRLAAAWHGTGSSPDLAQLLGQNYGFYYVAGAIYYLFPFQPMASFVNCIISTLSVFLVYRLASNFFQPMVARRAALLTSATPSMVVWSAVALKDPIVTFLILIALFSCVQLKRRFTPMALLGTILPVIALQPIRFYMVYFIGFSVVASLMLERGSRSLSGIYKQLVVVGGIVALLVLVGSVGRVSDGAAFLSFERASSFRRGMAMTANSGFAQNVDISTPAGALAFLPFGVAVLLLSPFPWQMTSLRALLAAPETIYWWFLIPSVIRGLRFVIRERWQAASPLLIFSTTLTLAYSLIHGNVGSGFRQRAQILVVLFIFGALGTYQRRCRRLGIDERELLKDR